MLQRWRRVAGTSFQTAPSVPQLVSTFRYAQWGQGSRGHSPIPQRCRPSDAIRLGLASRPNRQGEAEEDPSRSQLRPSSYLAAREMRFGGQRWGSPQLSTKCEGQRFPSLNKRFSVSQGLGGWLAPFFLSSSGPLLVPGNQPQPVASQRREPESRPVSQRPISEYRLQELAGQVETPEGCIPGEGPPFPAPTAPLSGSLSWPALTSTRTRALGLDLPEPEAVLSRCPPHLLPPRVARPAPQRLVRLQS